MTPYEADKLRQAGYRVEEIADLYYIPTQNPAEDALNIARLLKRRWEGEVLTFRDHYDYYIRTERTPERRVWRLLQEKWGAVQNDDGTITVHTFSPTWLALDIAEVRGIDFARWLSSRWSFYEDGRVVFDTKLLGVQNDA